MKIQMCHLLGTLYVRDPHRLLRSRQFSWLVVTSPNVFDHTNANLPCICSETVLLFSSSWFLTGNTIHSGCARWIFPIVTCKVDCRVARILLSLKTIFKIAVCLLGGHSPRNWAHSCQPYPAQPLARDDKNWSPATSEGLMLFPPHVIQTSGEETLALQMAWTTTPTTLYHWSCWVRLLELEVQS